MIRAPQGRGAGGSRRGRRRRHAHALAVALGLALGLAPHNLGQSVAPAPGWLVVDYSALVDLRRLSHSGESIETLLGRLGGRPLPAAGERPADRLAHWLLDPLLEPYAFVLADAADALGPLAQPARAELGSLWQPGEAQPAWVELLRARRYLVESDGRGRLRLFLPWSGAPTAPGSAAAAGAWREAYPVLRHALAAERRRLAEAAGAGAQEPPLELTIHAYRHLPARLEFALALEPLTVTLEETPRPDDRAPLDLGALREFVERGRQLEGGRLEPDGSLRLLESATAGAPPVLLGSPVTLADLAVAYRAVVHGGLTEPYMSLDRGDSPETTIVNYGGRLRDTRLGWVSLLCDLRLKTFSLGLDMHEGRDLRDELRELLPGFRTHVERFAAHPGSGGVLSQQVRLWFYPDDVDLTLSSEGDVAVLRRARMTATSERVQEDLQGGEEQRLPPWTAETVGEVNRHYDRLAGRFPELAELDVGVRLLSLFTWLRHAASLGHRMPDLDALLQVEVPVTPTPRSYPQLLAFNALPPVADAAVAGAVRTYDRLVIAEALANIQTWSGRPPAARLRFARARESLDRRNPDHRALLDELEATPVEQLADSDLDVLAYRAERLLMHQTVLATLPPELAEPLVERQRRGEALRVFSVAIGGIDLGMGQALARGLGRSRSLGLGPGGPTGDRRAGSAAAQAASGRATVGIVAEDPAPVAALPRVPDHGEDVVRPGFLLRRVPGSAPGAGAGAVPPTVVARYGAHGPELRGRTVELDATGRGTVFERVEDGRWLRFRLERSGARLRATLEPGARRDLRAAALGGAVPPPGLALLALEPAAAADRGASGSVGLRILAGPGGEPRELATELPRASLRGLAAGSAVVPPAVDPLQGVFPLPERLGDVRSVLVVPDPARLAPPWSGANEPRLGEEDPLRFADALHRWWSGRAARPGGLGVAVGVDGAASPDRWRSAPLPGKRPTLILPADGFPAPFAELREPLARAWTAGRVEERLPGKKVGELVVLASAEPPGLFASRLHRLATHPAMRGKLLAGWCLFGEVRADLPARLLEEGGVAGVGIARGSVSGLREAPARLARWSAALSARSGDARVEQLDGPFLWYF